MRIADWIERTAALPALSETLETLASGGEIRSVASEARPWLIAADYLRKPRRTLILAASYERALAWQAKLVLCGVPVERIRQLPSGLSALFEDAMPEHIALSERIGALEALVEKGPNIVIAAAPAALERTLPREILADAFITVKAGATLDSDKLLRQLARLGYENAEPVRIPGQFSRRGGIVDVFASGGELPVRIELFGDVVESLRTFDQNSQRSVAPLKVLRIAPSRETLHAAEDFNPEILLDAMEREASALQPEAAQRLEELVSADANALRQGVFFDRLDLYRPFLHPESGCALDLLDEDDLLVLDEPIELESVSARAEQELAHSLQARANRGEILHSTALDYVLPPEHLASHGLVVTLSAMNTLPDWLSLSRSADANIASLEPYRGQAIALAKTLKTYLDGGFLTLVATDQPNRASSVLEQISIHPSSEAQEKGIVLAAGNLAGGFVAPEAKFAVVTDAEIFGVARLRLPQKRFLEGAPIATVLDLKPGDYVVHINFGIGVFRGLAKRMAEGVEKEYLFIEYAAPDKLFVPADQLDRIQKYLNPGDAMPKLNRLTGTEWQRTISKAREDAREFARDLVKLYAQRHGVQRRPIGPDTPWQQEMEATFPWVETPSQMAAIRDAKRDLSAPFPMDRLVCGDVGFGKTEVAIRAAFKVAQAGKQVAVLCPTTILSEQHYRNFSERLASFPVRLALVNRYQTTASRHDTAKKLKTGDVEIVIGTHALLAAEIEFKDLGLVIVDEEQKFGVKQKEALKQLRTNVDVLSMSATPIPRTLSMALMDIRQMSLINDPPPGRLPIRTFLRPYSQDVVREAILRELARGGQVFYVYNRVEGISHVAERLRRLVPMARIGVGHGQMTEAEIEPVMIGFIKGEIDVLLSTTIIENGIDIPNANTLIVENADRLGLSQLYQLRGRVGRSDRQAYAYLLYQSNRELTDNSMARLQALQEFSSLGSGYSLAFRDLQIRGAGELLGKKQHGTMTTVGYELYTQLIEEAVTQLKSSVDGTIEDGAPKDPLASTVPLPTVELPVEAFLPESYISVEAQRLYSYQRLMSCRSHEQLGEVRSEVEDRYGRMPEPAKAAFDIVRLRVRSLAFDVEKVDGKGGRLSIVFRNVASISTRAFRIFTQRRRDAYLTQDRLIVPYSGKPIAALERAYDELQEALDEVEEARKAAEAWT